MAPRFPKNTKTMDGSRAHLIGIRGNGMRAMADVLVGWGWSITGSDMSLRGHAAENVPAESDVVIYSDAIPPDNPERRRAVELDIPAVSYFQALGKITSGEHTIAVAGTHGKSTTAAIIGHILTEAGWNPTVFCGATPIGKTSGGRAGRKDFFVVEACEYRKNFLHLRPTHAAILGIETDHFDCFRDLAEIESAFRQFAELLPENGHLLHRDDCPTTQKVSQRIDCRRTSFGFSPTAGRSARCMRQERGYYRFSIFMGREMALDVKLPMAGRHNVLNALAAVAICADHGVSSEKIRHGLETFPGLHRRFEIFHSSFPRSGVGTPCADAAARVYDGALVSDSFNAGASENGISTPERENKPLMGQIGNLSYVMDYAHHPTEVAFALDTAREVFPNRRIWCIFQPHQTSRTARLLDELALSLQNADKVIVAEIFRTREGTPKPGEITAADLARRTAEIAKSGKDGEKVLPIYQTDDIMDALATQVQPGDVIITLGAGDIHSVLSIRSWCPNLRPIT